MLSFCSVRHISKFLFLEREVWTLRRQICLQPVFSLGLIQFNVVSFLSYASQNWRCPAIACKFSATRDRRLIALQWLEIPGPPEVQGQ